MTSPARFAFGYGRVRAMKSRLLGPEDGLRLRAPGAAAALLEESGVPPGQARTILLSRLAVDVARLIRSYPAGRSLLLALAGLDEIENVKLLFRAHVRKLPAELWAPLWLPLGPLAVLSLEDWREAGALRSRSRELSRTPYGDLAASVLRAHEDDLQAAELAFDRWASLRLQEEARKLPAEEGRARDLALRIVRERDIDLFRRGPRTYRLPFEIVANAMALLGEELDREALERLAKWKPAEGPLEASIAARLGLRRSPPPDWDRLTLWLRRARRASCFRAFRGDPFDLAPPVAYFLLRREEVRALTALARALPEERDEMPVARALAAGSMGA
jgi:vacuolar-type H+-ATPase subunit C/Vma6